MKFHTAILSAHMSYLSTAALMSRASLLSTRLLQLGYREPLTLEWHASRGVETLVYVTSNTPFSHSELVIFKQIAGDFSQSCMLFGDEKGVIYLYDLITGRYNRLGEIKISHFELTPKEWFFRTSWGEIARIYETT